MEFQINDIKKYKRIAKYLLDEWVYEYELFDNIVNINQMIVYLRTKTRLVFTLTYDGILIGFALLVDNDCDVCPDIKPWLASVYIVPEYRNMGFSKILLNYIKEYTTYKSILFYLWCQTDKLKNFYISMLDMKQIDYIEKHHHLSNIIVLSKR